MGKLFWRIFLAQGKSRSTVNSVLAPLREMFNHAIEDGHVDRNPCLRILKRSRKEEGERKQKTDFLTREELGVLLRTCQEHFPVYYPLISFLARTGVRFGEALEAVEKPEKEEQSLRKSAQRVTFLPTHITLVGGDGNEH